MGLLGRSPSQRTVTIHQRRPSKNRLNAVDTAGKGGWVGKRAPALVSAENVGDAAVSLGAPCDLPLKKT